MPDRISDEPPTYRPMQLTPIEHPPMGGLRSDELPFAGYEPEFPAHGSELEKVLWLAGRAEIELMCRIEVVVDYDARSGFGLRFFAPPGREGLTMEYAGEDAGQVDQFLRGIAYRTVLIKRHVLDR